MMYATVLQLVVALTSVCTVARGHDNYGLPAPVFSMNITQDEDVGVEKRVFRRLAAKGEDAGMAPLFEGLGTHYSFIWVGTPAQRVSVIMDTGSHHTAFPCTGCKCGKHMDPHFDPKKSSTNTIKSCGNDGKKCYFKQSYTEGSSWSAYKVRDRVWVGGPGEPDVEKAHAKAIDFDFGCQESETGLFRTQKVDGIMGLSAAPDTLPFQLHAAGVTRTKMFALCFRTGGGVVTLGGVDTRLHATSPLPGAESLGAGGAAPTNRTSLPGLYFAQMTKAKGWYTVKMLDVLMRSPGSGGSLSLSEAKSIGGDASKYNAGKGTIVDSGTTDTYLPSALRNQFQTLFRAVTGREYGNKQAHYTKDQFDRLPIIVFRLAGTTPGATVDLEVFPTSYMEFHKDSGGSAGGAGRYTPRIYLTEGSGAVLGANSINEHNVIFDPDGLRVGFARSRCRYDKKHSKHDFATSTNAVGSAPATKPDTSQVTKPPPSSATKEKKEPPSPVKPKSGSSSSEAKKAEAPKKKPSAPATANKQPAKDAATGANSPSSTAKPSSSLSPTRVPLTPAQQSAMDAVVAASARSFVATRHAACKPVLSIPCDARCDHSPFSEPVDGVSSASTIDYMHVDSRGEVSALTASVVKGQQYWKVPVCEDVAAVRRLSLRGLKEGDGNDADPATVGAVVVARTVREECAVTCTGSEYGAGQLVRLNTALPVESAASQCDAVSHTRKQLQIDMSRTVDAPSARDSVIVLTKAGTQAQQCYIMEGAAAVHAGAGAAARHELSPNTQCHTVAVVESACKPYQGNCTSTVRSVNGARANFDAVAVDADDVVFTVHMRLKGLVGGTLTDFQEADLIAAFAGIFKVPAARLSVAVVNPAPSRFSFGLGSLGSVARVQVFVRLNIALAGGDPPVGGDAGPPGFALPDEAVDLIALVSGSRVGASTGRAHSVHRQIARDQLQAYLQAIVLQPEFPLVLSSAVAEADPTLSIPTGTSAADDTVKRPAWLVSSAVSMVGVGFLSGKIDGSTMSSAEKAHMDALNAAVCAGIDHSWTGYLSMPTDLLSSANGYFSGPQGAWTVNAAMSLVLFAVLLTAACLLRRRYILNRERASRDTGKPYAADDAEEARPGAAQAGAEGSAGAPHRAAAHAPSHKDRRRKVLQKFAVKK